MFSLDLSTEEAKASTNSDNHESDYNDLNSFIFSSCFGHVQVFLDIPFGLNV